LLAAEEITDCPTYDCAGPSNDDMAVSVQLAAASVNDATMCGDADDHQRAPKHKKTTTQTVISISG
jgi:hypothetical protein